MNSYSVVKLSNSFDTKCLALFVFSRSGIPYTAKIALKYSMLFALVTVFIVWCYVLVFSSPTIYVGLLLRTNEVKQRGQKNIQNKAVQTKLNLYINKYIKKRNITNILI